MEETIVIEVDNRKLVLGIDEMYRAAMMEFEERTLLPAAKKIADALGLEAGEVPVEGYYRLSPGLEEYFRIVRALQKLGRIGEIEDLDEYRLLYGVASSPIYGRKEEGNGLLPVMKDPLYFALEETPVEEWSAAVLVEKARRIAGETGDCSLVGLAALCRDAVLLAALRETMVLYSAVLLLGIPPQYEYVWRVDPEIEEAANRFIALFNDATGAKLAPAHAENAGIFYKAFERCDYVGRCARIAADDREWPARHFHWAVKFENDAPALDEFWDTELWTTEKYRNEKFSGWYFE